MLTRNATLFRKRTDGTFPLRTYLLLWPYLSLYTLIIYFHRKIRKYEPVATQVMPGWYLSGWINNAECLRAAGSSLKKVAILDMTCELPRRLFSCDTCDVQYMNIPILDRLSPSVDDIAKAAKWCNEMRKQDYDVVVHCAFGHGRSATCFIAALLAAGAQSGIDETESWLQGMRPHVKLTKEQYGRLTEWTKSNKCD